jgi:hypothetical protein
MVDGCIRVIPNAKISHWFLYRLHRMRNIRACPLINFKAPKKH